MMMASSSGSKPCFNRFCTQAVEVPKQGWLCRTGDYADLCHRCSSVYKDGKFCDTYHVNTAGWRCCESCGKQIHCGCIVSFHMFVLLDAGGIECLNCAKTEYILTPNPSWPCASPFHHGAGERVRDISSRNWRSIAGSGPVPWRQAPVIFNTFKGQPESQSTSCSLGKRTTNNPSEGLVNDVWRVSTSEMIGGDRSTFTGGQSDGKHNSFKDVPYQSKSLSHTNALPRSSFPTTFVEYDKSSEKGKTSKAHFQRLCSPPSVGKPCYNNNGADVSIEAQAHSAFARGVYCQRLCPPPSVGKPCCNNNGADAPIGAQTLNAIARGEVRSQWLCPPPSVGKPCCNNSGAEASTRAQAHNVIARGDTWRPQLLPRYWPRITDQELQQISRGSNAKITPLFEKVLSASDVGKIGRLVLPKKCAEAYLPPISQPEGCPLVIQDLNGNDWVLHFRFWFNNGSKLYVLEGVAPCIQSMKLQAGDTVTFSRLEPDGKLVMGSRKVPLASTSDKGNATTRTRVSTHEEPLKSSIVSKSKNPDSILSEIDKASIPAKRKKGGSMCSNNEHLKLDEEILQFKVTLEQVQGLLRPPLTNTPTVVFIEDVEFEEYQEAPMIGSPTSISTNHVGFLSSTEVEQTQEHLEHYLPMINHASSKQNISENSGSLKTIEGISVLADIASSQATARHPCHKAGCTCISCSRPPSATKHKSTCSSDVCRGKEVGNSIQNQTQLLYADIIRYSQRGSSNLDYKTGPNERFENMPNKESSSNLSFTIDLNIQPEREEESSPVSDSMGVMKLVQESTHRYLRQQKLSIHGGTDGNH
uniref:B3 domain-containing transcription factor VAL3-like isoform X2 n=1 Tax=Erigeron canadensis TaxID=72917 RepID=UPI001CB98595|nr:B3 domain-containing transcription factor VAL3-like isoform X2 [Erigeron canadensis]